MAFNLADVFNNGATSSIVSNPISTSLSSLTSSTSGISGLNPATGSIGSAISAVNSLISSAQNYMTTEIENLKTKLPIMAAVHSMSKSVLPLGGTNPGINADSLLSGATQGITQLGPMMQTVSSSVGSSISGISGQLTGVSGNTPQEKLMNFSASVPPATILSGDNITYITNPAYTTFLSTNAGKITGLNSIASSINSSISSTTSFLSGVAASETSSTQAGVSKLRDMAFAKFSSSTQPPAVQSIMDKFVTPPSSSTQVDSLIMAASRQKSRVIAESSAPSVSKIPTNVQTAEAGTSAPTVQSTDLKTMSDTDLAAYRTTLVQQNTQLKTWKDRVTSKQVTVDSWKASVNYEQIKRDYLADTSNSDNKAAYFTLRDQLSSSSMYQDYFADATAYNSACKRMKEDVDAFNRATESGGPSLIAGIANFGALALAVLNRR